MLLNCSTIEESFEYWKNQTKMGFSDFRDFRSPYGLYIGIFGNLIPQNCLQPRIDEDSSISELNDVRCVFRDVERPVGEDELVHYLNDQISDRFNYVYRRNFSVDYGKLAYGKRKRCYEKIKLEELPYYIAEDLKDMDIKYEDVPDSLNKFSNMICDCIEA